MAENSVRDTVKSVFKNGKSTVTQQEFTEALAELINKSEKGKANAFVKTRE